MINKHLRIIQGIVLTGVMVAGFMIGFFVYQEEASVKEASVKEAPVKPEMVMMHWEYGSDVVGYHSTEPQMVSATTCSYIKDSALVWESESGSYTRIFCEPMFSLD